MLDTPVKPSVRQKLEIQKPDMSLMRLKLGVTSRQAEEEENAKRHGA